MVSLWQSWELTREHYAQPAVKFISYLFLLGTLLIRHALEA